MVYIPGFKSWLEVVLHQKTYMKKIIILVLMLVWGAIQALNAQIPQSLADRLQHVTDSVSIKFNIKGISAAVYIPGYGTWTGVYGYSHDTVKITPDMLFCMGSNTKTHIAALLLKLQEDGKIDLDDSIGKWIQGYPNINGKVTLRQCLNHTSGIADYFHNNAINDSILGEPTKIWTDDEMLRMAQAPLFAPGAQWSYSNTNYIILGIIIRDIVQKSQFAALSEEILAPAGLTHTYNFGEQPPSAVYAHPWTMNLTGNSLTDITATDYLDQLFSLATTAGGLMTTAEENVMFWHKLFTSQLISPAAFNEMTTMKPVGSGLAYGLGIMRNRTNNRVVYEHGGTFFGFLNENLVDTLSGVCISVLTNQDSVNNNGIRQLYVANLHKEILNSALLSTGEVLAPIRLSVYPNPASAVLNIEMENNNEILLAELFDMQGRNVKQQDVEGFSTRINVEHLPEGIYYLKISDDAGRVLGTEKVVVRY